MQFNNLGKLINLVILATISIAIFMLAENVPEQSSSGKLMTDAVRARTPSSFNSAVLIQAKPSNAANLTWL
jgi:divalent metal cation (Fe/Co/Zn/Cd) transporter